MPSLRNASRLRAAHAGRMYSVELGAPTLTNQIGQDLSLPSVASAMLADEDAWKKQ